MCDNPIPNKRRKEDERQSEVRSEEDMMQRLSVLEIENKLLKKENEELKIHVEEYKTQNEGLKKHIERLRDESEKSSVALSDQQDEAGLDDVRKSGFTKSNDSTEDSMEQDTNSRELIAAGGNGDLVIPLKGFKLFVEGISKEVPELDIQREFEKFGCIFTTYNTGQGSAYVTFHNEDNSMMAVEQMNNKIAFGRQIKIEVAKTGLLDLPSEIITLINNKLSFQDKKRFREVALMCPFLRRLYKDEIGIIKLDFDKVDVFSKFLEFQTLLNSRFEINLQLSIYEEYGTSMVQILGERLIKLVDVCPDRITQICMSGGAEPTDVLEEVLPELTNLKRIKIEAPIYSEFIEDMIDDNADGLQYLGLTNIPDFDFQDMPKLRELEITSWEDKSIQSLLSGAPNISKLVIDGDSELSLTNINLKETPQGPREKLDDLRLFSCKGDVSSFLSQAASTISRLELYNIQINTEIQHNFVNLKHLKLSECKGEISSLLTQAASIIRVLKLERVDLDTSVDEPFSRLKSLWIGSRKINFTDSPLLTRSGRLKEFFIKIKRN